MTQLLNLALALLIAAQSPNVSPEMRLQAISVAQTAISYATMPSMDEEIKKEGPEEAPYGTESVKQEIPVEPPAQTYRRLK